MILVWLAVGILAVGYAYWSAPHSTDPWGPLNLAGLVAGAYVLILSVSTLRKPFSRRFRSIAWVSVLFAGVAIISAWTGFESQSRYQARTLLEIRETISRNIIAGEFSTVLLKTLEVYHSQGDRRRRTLESIFREQTGADIGTNIHAVDYESDHLSVVVAGLNADEILLVAQEGMVSGRDPLFRNLDGSTGKIQETARLTSRGITYESQN